jgi:YidC/Oxa1 family membrane protein insertase
LQAIGALYTAMRNALAGPMLSLLLILFHAMAGMGISSWGLTIIVFTVLVKLVFWPLTVQQLRASKAMQSLQPQLNELKKQHGKDREKLMQAQMELYKQNRVNPMAGCLPMLIQFPIWIGLYQALYLLQANQADFASRFLWIPSLAQPDPLFILGILTAASQFIVQRMLQVNNTDPQQKQMNQMMQFMPLMYLFISYKMPAGLVLYWVASNLFTLIQQSFYTGWSGVLPARFLPAAVVPAARGRREPTAAPAATAAVPLVTTNGAAVSSSPANGGRSASGSPAISANGASGGSAPRRVKKRRK